MAFLTENDLKRIAKYLANNGIKDSQFDDSNYPFTGDEYVVLVKDNINKKIKIKDLILSTGDTTVGENGNWFYKGEDTGIQAKGPQGPQGLPGEVNIEDLKGTIKEIINSCYNDVFLNIKGDGFDLTIKLVSTITNNYYDNNMIGLWDLNI